MRDFFKKLFHQEPEIVPTDTVATPAGQDVKTSPLTDEQLDAIGSGPESSFKPAQFLVGCAQSVGRQRDHNEDTMYCLYSMLADGGMDIPFGIFLVADGMGGHQYGEIASRTAARTISNYLVEKMYVPYLHPETERSHESMQEIMEQGVRIAHQAVAKNAPGGGTTLTTAVVVGEQITITQIGDSRAYFIYPDGRINAITKDHTLVRRLVELGQITEEEALTHPNRNVLYRALGQNDPFKPDIETRLLPHPCYLLVCSDGLWGVISETQICDIIKSTKNPSEACAALVDAANAAGGPDNISVILAHYL